MLCLMHDMDSEICKMITIFFWLELEGEDVGKGIGDWGWGMGDERVNMYRI